MSDLGYNYIYFVCGNSVRHPNSKIPIHDPQLLQKLTPTEVQELKAEFAKYLTPQSANEVELVFSHLAEGQSEYKQFNGYVSVLIHEKKKIM